MVCIMVEYARLYLYVMAKEIAKPHIIIMYKRRAWVTNLLFSSAEKLHLYVFELL